jgi:hypothetical protein
VVIIVIQKKFAGIRGREAGERKIGKNLLISKSRPKIIERGNVWLAETLNNIHH